MTYAEMKEAIARVPVAALHDLSCQLYALMRDGTISDDEVQALAEAIHARRKAVPAPAQKSEPVALGALIAPTERQIRKFADRRQRSPDRARSRERCRMLGSTSPLHPTISGRYTDGERAVLCVVGGEIASHGLCDLSVSEIAARAGVCHRRAQTALRLAERDGLITITERPRKGQKHQTNVIRVLCREWAAWLAKRRPTGCRPLPATAIQDSSFSLESKKAARGSVAKGFRRGDSRSGPAGRPAASAQF